MKAGLKTGLSQTRQFIVDTTHTIDFANDVMPAVLSTPRLIGELERTAREAITPFLDPEETSVGTHVDLDHLAATPIGSRVTCLARVLTVDGRLIAFQIEARDEKEVVARGFHRRHVINAARFASRVKKKLSQSSSTQSH